MPRWDRIRRSQGWKSIFRHAPPVDRPNRVTVILTNLVLHLHPVAMPKHSLRLRFTWCMGGISFFLFLVEVVTGVLLMFTLPLKMILRWTLDLSYLVAMPKFQLNF